MTRDPVHAALVRARLRMTKETYMPTSWSRDMIWWHVYPLGFTGAERSLADAGPDPVPRLAQLEHWLDYAVALGANGLLLGPIFRSATHGYDTLDHFAIDPRLGTAATFTHLVAACRSKGIRVALDGVFNHVSRDNEIVRRALAGGPGSEDGRWTVSYTHLRAHETRHE